MTHYAGKTLVDRRISKAVKRAKAAASAPSTERRKSAQKRAWYAAIQRNKLG